jgi:PAS domain S-box-containing protein
MGIVPMTAVPDEFYRHLHQSLDVALITTDADLKIQTWNAAAARVFGVSVEQMRGRPIEELVPPERRQLARRLFRRALHNRENTQFETPYRDPQGNDHFIAVTLSPVIDDAGACLGVAAAVRDRTRQNALEQEMAQSRRMAALGTLSGSMAHHFNNLLGGMATSVDFALVTADQAAMRRALQQTAESVARAAKITKSLLTFAESDLDSDPEGPIADVVRAFVERQGPELAKHHVTLVTRIEPVPEVLVPARRATTLLEKLFDNAFEAMPEGGQIQIELARGVGEVYLAVEDTGPGIPADQSEQVFTPFYTTKGALGGGFGGHVGLGLAVVHGIVGGLGGTVIARCAPGRGARIEIRLPTQRLGLSNS